MTVEKMSERHPTPLLNIAHFRLKSLFFVKPSLNTFSQMV
jgi:hypothetical protein